MCLKVPLGTFRIRQSDGPIPQETHIYTSTQSLLFPLLLRLQGVQGLREPPTSQENLARRGGSAKTPRLARPLLCHHSS